MSDPSSARIKAEVSSQPVHRRAVGISIIAMLLALLGGYAIWWWIAVTQTEVAIDNWIAERRTEGWQVSYKNRQTDGFPFSIRVEIALPQVQNGVWAWQGEKLELSGKPWSLTEVDFDLGGLHKGQVLMGGQAEPFTLAAANFGGYVRLDEGRAQGIVAEGVNLKLHLEARDQTFTLSAFEMNVEQRNPKQTDWRMRLRDLRVPQTLRAPLGSRLQHVDAKGQFDEVLGGGSLKEALSSWRDRGGKLKVQALDVGYSSLRLAGEGTVALDSRLQPTAAFATRARGVMATIDSLAETGLIKGRDSLAAKLVLGALSKTPDGGGERYLDLDLTLENRTLSAGPFKLLRLKPVRW